jgi:hypothetical protein
MNRAVSFPTVFSIALASSGCFGPSGFTRIASIEGKWTGTVVAVPAVDAQGNRVPAAALKLTNGQTWALGEELGSGREPLLIQGPPNEYQIIDPATLPMGRQVEVEGKTIVLYAEGGATSGRVTRTRRPAGDPLNEHVLVVRHLEVIGK